MLALFLINIWNYCTDRICGRKKEIPDVRKADALSPGLTSETAPRANGISDTIISPASDKFNPPSIGNSVFGTINGSKKIGGGRVVLIETVSKSRNSLQFKNIIGVTEDKYINRYEKLYKKRNMPNSGGSKSFNTSPPDGRVSDTIISPALDKFNPPSVGNSVFGQEIIGKILGIYLDEKTEAGIVGRGDLSGTQTPFRNEQKSNTV